MKFFISLIVPSLIIISCNSTETKTTEIEKHDSISKFGIESKSKLEIDSNIALNFINDYTEFCNNQFSRDNNLSTLEWVEKNNLVSDNFKKAFKNLIKDAEEDNPELGLGFDPIFDAQDFPYKGFELFKIDNSGYVIVIGKDWKEFKLPIKLIFKDNKWIVDGAGIINIPKDKQIDKK